MRITLIVSVALLMSACGQSNEEQLSDAANQSDPAAAEVLNGAAENGMDPQQALQEAGNAAAMSNTDAAPPSAQARPNTAEDPNRPQSGEPPEKIVSNTE
jgi:hypothetical protein